MKPDITKKRQTGCFMGHLTGADELVSKVVDAPSELATKLPDLVDDAAKAPELLGGFEELKAEEIGT